MNIGDAEEGARLVADGGFDCISEGGLVTVGRSECGGLFVPCKRGKHFLGGQIGPRGRLIGFSKATK
jgi:hypothetical protein